MLCAGRLHAFWYPKRTALEEAAKAQLGWVWRVGAGQGVAVFRRHASAPAVPVP